MNGKSSLLKKANLLPYLWISGISFAVTAVVILIVFAIFGMAPFGPSLQRRRNTDDRPVLLV